MSRFSTNSFLFFVAALLLLPFPLTSFYSFTFGVRFKSPSGNSGKRTEVASFSAQKYNDALDRVPRNMFQSSIYDKPIVLLGCSGVGGELKRLAQSLREQINRKPTEVSNERNGDVTVAGLHDNGSSTMLLNKDDLLRRIKDRQLKSSDVVVLDFDDEGFTMDGGRNAAELCSSYSKIAKALYSDAGVLSIYVNVHPEEGQMTTAATDRKSELEHDVFVRYSDYELCIKGEGVEGPKTEKHKEAWSHIEWELRRLVARALLVPAIPGGENSSVNSPYLTMGDHTFFLSLSFPDITEVKPYVEEMCKDIDAMEYRTDLLKCRDSRFGLIYGQQLLRKYCRPYAKRAPGLPFRDAVIDDAIPIVYTVRTENQAGTYPDDDNGISKMFEMLVWGLRSGVEVLDVESAWDTEKTNELLSLAEQRYSSQILGSHHVVGKEISTEDAVKLFQQCALSGRAHGAKVVLSIEQESSDRMAYEAAIIASSLAEKEGKPVIPNISLILGDVGMYSRVLNFPFTPVTHESLPFKAAPGQMTSNEIMTARLLTKLFSPMRYCILGHNIAYSVSPQMQGAAFAATKLPHEYFIADEPKVEQFVESDFFKAADFGGCSVTIPHKQAIIPYVDVLSDAAKKIGSVNTLVVKEEYGDDEIMRVIYGDNTDWRGIYNPLERKLGGAKSSSKIDCALIVGAGGTARAAAFAAEKLGLERLYYNRTPSKAAELANEFGGEVVTDLDSSNDKGLGNVLDDKNGVLRVVISTLPADAEFTLPESVVSKNNSANPIVFDVNYKPYYTKLLTQAELCGCQLVRGSEMLWEQGVGQFELWTGRSAPYKVMKEAVLENCIPKETSADESEVEEPAPFS